VPELGDLRRFELRPLSVVDAYNLRKLLDRGYARPRQLWRSPAPAGNPLDPLGS
jgi:hypothetical protein